jgi:hypothetical protein
MGNYTQEQLELADMLDALEPGEGLETVNGTFIERESDITYVVNHERRVSFVQAFDLAIR